MNEFIVWDEDNKCFQGNVKLYLSEAFILGGEMIKNSSIHQYVGKTDDTSEKNKVYADCSIVEFDIPYNSGRVGKDKGVVKYDVDYLQYFIFSEDYIYEYKEISNLKVIGTIQENKELWEN